MIGDEEPVVRVTLSTIYNKLLDVEKKVDPIPAAIVDHETRMRAVEKAIDPEVIDDHEKRMRALEGHIARQRGVNAVIAFLVSSGIAAVIHFAHL